MEEQDKESSKNKARRLRMSAIRRQRRRTTTPVRTQELRAEGGLAGRLAGWRTGWQTGWRTDCADCRAVRSNSKPLNIKWMRATQGKESVVCISRHAIVVSWATTVRLSQPAGGESIQACWTFTAHGKSEAPNKPVHCEPAEMSTSYKPSRITML